MDAETLALLHRVQQLELLTATLSKQLRAMEAARHRVTVPFAVTDAQGRTVLEVVDSQLRILSPTGTPLAALGADSLGGWMTTRSQAGELLCYVNAESYGGRLI